MQDTYQRESACRPQTPTPSNWHPAQLKRRATFDAALLLGLTALAITMLHNKGLQGAMLIVGSMTMGSILFVIRRGLDFSRLADQQRQLDSRTRGLGIPLADWQSGMELPPWHERTLRRDVAIDENSTRTVQMESL